MRSLFLLGACMALTGFGSENPPRYLNDDPSLTVYPAIYDDVKEAASPRTVSPFQTETEDSYASLQKSLDSLVRSGLGGSGVTLALAVPGREMWVGAAGYANRGGVIIRDENNKTVRDEYGLVTREGSVKMRPEDLLYIGSCTKVVVGALTLKLAEEGTLSLDDTLEQRLPGTGIRYAETITLRQMLSHTSGIYEFTGNSRFWNALDQDPSRGLTPWEILEMTLSGPVFAPGTKGRWSYCNTNYLLMGLVIERTTGKPFYTVLREKLYTPLGLENIYNAGEAGFPTNVVPGYGTGGPAIGYNMNWAFGAGHICTDAENFGKLIHGIFTSDWLLPSSRQTLTTPIANGYGLGVGMAVSTDPKGTIYSHSGRVPGFQANYVHHKESGVTAVMLYNTDAEGLTGPIQTSLEAVRLGARLAKQPAAVADWKAME